MGKNSVRKTLGKRIGNIVLHKLLAKYTNKPESISYLQNEEEEYRNAAMKDTLLYHWNEEDKQLIKEYAFDFIKNRRNTRYTDVEFSMGEAEKAVKEEMIAIGM